MSTIKALHAVFILTLSAYSVVAAPVEPVASVSSSNEALSQPIEAQPPQPTLNTTTQATIEQPKHEDAVELPDFTSYKDTSTFSCSGKVTGYYADVKLSCRVYHFCTQMDVIGGEQTYQRMSYICLEDSYFDQKDLNCVKEDQLKVPCDRAEAEYESSNKQFDPKEERGPSISDSLTANIMMNPITRFIAGR